MDLMKEPRVVSPQLKFFPYDIFSDISALQHSSFLFQWTFYKPLWILNFFHIILVNPSFITCSYNFIISWSKSSLQITMWSFLDPVSDITGQTLQLPVLQFYIFNFVTLGLSVNLLYSLVFSLNCQIIIVFHTCTASAIRVASDDSEHMSALNH